MGELRMRWDEEAAKRAVRSEWTASRDAKAGAPAEVFDVLRFSDGTFVIELPYAGSAPAGTRLRVVGRSADEAVARALREIECRGSGEFFRGF